MTVDVEARDIWFSYLGDKNYAVRGASIIARAGETLAIVGPTGCGKSTLLLILAGLLKPQKGSVYYNGKLITELLPGIRRVIGFLFQDPEDQLFNPTVFDEVAYALRTMGLPEQRIRELVESISVKLRIKHLLSRPPYKLSVGEKKRVALASILVYDPEVLILDEPTANLDAEGVSMLVDIVLKARKQGKTVILASHDLEFVFKVADRVYIMREGRIQEEVPGRELLRPEILDKVNIAPPLVARVIERLGVKYEDIVELARSEDDDQSRTTRASPIIEGELSSPRGLGVGASSSDTSLN